MSVVVMGMEMPKSCESCRVTCELWIMHKPGQRHPDCPLLPLPEKHGRLIDADAFKSMCRENVESLRDTLMLPHILPHEKEMLELLTGAIESLCLDLDEAHTIVEAEGGSDE